MLPGDIVLSVNDSLIHGFYDCVDILKYYAGDTVQIKLIRGDEIILNQFEISENGKLGFAPKREIIYSSHHSSLPESIAIGFGDAFGVLWLNIKAIGKMFGGNVTPTKSSGGPIGVAKIYGQHSWAKFWRITGIMMMVTALWNILPMPNSVFLQLLPLLKEGVTGKPMTMEGFKKLNWIPYTILGLVMVFAIFSDMIMAM